ncbi:serine protease [Gryganskiella cystojenkinii]|nr:serine protease [Gryganskiella cystojenkinii]
MHFKTPTTVVCAAVLAMLSIAAALPAGPFKPIEDKKCPPGEQYQGLHGGGFGCVEIDTRPFKPIEDKKCPPGEQYQGLHGGGFGCVEIDTRPLKPIEDGRCPPGTAICSAMLPLVFTAILVSSPATSGFTSLMNATWGISRISQRNRLGTEPYTYNYSPHAGEGVAVYVISTGINVNHEEFQGRAIWGTTTAKGSPDVDKNGYGTHCAGIIASGAYGVAKQAQVVAVKSYKIMAVARSTIL